MLSKMDDQVTALYRVGRYAEALRIAEKALQMAKRNYHIDHIYVRNAQNNLRLLHIALKKQAAISEALAAARPRRKKIRRGGVSLRVALVFLFVLSSFTFDGLVVQKFQRPQTVSAQAAQGDGSPEYRVDADFYPDEKTVSGEEEVLFALGEAKNEIKFNLYLNRYRDTGLNGYEIRKYAIDRGMDSGHIDIQRVSYNGEAVPFRVDGETLTVSLKNGTFFPGEHTLKIWFKAKVPFISDRVGGNSGGMWLGNWLPTLSAGRSYQPTEIGDPFVNLSSTYDVRFSVPEKYSLVLSNTGSVTEKNGRRFYRARLERVRDLPVFINLGGYEKASVKEGPVTINYYYTSSDSRKGEVLDAAARAISFYGGLAGEYPWEQLNIVENDMYLNGMEYSTMVLVSTRALHNNAYSTVFHEVGHQWFYNMVGSDQYADPFLDEGMVEYLTSMALEDRDPGYWEDFGGLGAGLSDFRWWQQYRDANYHNGSRWFESLCHVLGKDGFKRFVKDYADTYRYGLVSREEFCKFTAGHSEGLPVKELLSHIDN
ncbi:MAG: M1 family aminopeptidase [Bacillota bacterium]